MHLKKIHSQSYWYYCSHNSTDCSGDNEILEIWIWKFSSGSKINLIDWIDGCVSFRLCLSVRKSKVNHGFHSWIEDIQCFIEQHMYCVCPHCSINNIMIMWTFTIQSKSSVKEKLYLLLEINSHSQFLFCFFSPCVWYLQR